jgi:fructose transport system substrate-binding protein
MTVGRKRASKGLLAVGAATAIAVGVAACGSDNGSSGGGGGQEQVTIGLITKSEANPFFVKM